MDRNKKLYSDFLAGFFNLKSSGKTGTKTLKVVFDCSNGTTGAIIKRIAAGQKNLKAIILNSKPDGNFPAHGPNPLDEKILRGLGKRVLKSKADMGIAFDADGDRAFFTDDKGRLIHPDDAASILIWSLKPKNAVIDVRTGWAVREKSKEGIKIFESKVGHYFIKKIMRENDVEFGCEGSGHYYFKKFFFTDAGILAAIEMINAVLKMPYNLSDFIDLSPRYFRSWELNARHGDADSKKLFKKIENHYKTRAFKTGHLDGLSMEFNPLLPDRSGGWRFNIRFSNTEPLARINVEARNKRILVKETGMLLRLLYGKAV